MSIAHVGSMSRIPLARTFRWLGYAGLAPFVGGALGLVVVEHPEQAERLSLLLAAYGAVILSFLGAVHWGRALVVAMGPRLQRHLATLSVLPSVLAWASLALAPPWVFWVQAALLALFYPIDRRAWGGLQPPRGYFALRLQLTSVACVSLLVAGVAVGSGVGATSL
jgi:hypothetical protein